MMLFKPCPILATDDCRDGRVLYSVLFAQFAHVNSALLVALAYFSDLFLGELGDTVRAAARMTTLSHFVSNVVIVCAKKEMRRVTTWPIITLVEYMQATRDGAKCVNVSNAVCMKLAEVPGVSVETISVDVLWPLPLPTIIRSTLVHLCPKVSFGKYLFGLDAFVMIPHEAHGISLEVSRRAIIVLNNSCFLPATAVAITVGNFVRGIMGLHKKFTFLVSKPWTVPAVAGLLLLVRTPVIIAQEGLI